MTHDDPFTLDLFGAPALSSGLGLGVAALAGGFVKDLDDDPDPPPPAAPSAPRARPGATKRARGANFHLVGGRGLAAGWKDRARDNIAAIRLAAEIEAAERPATADEQRQLIRFIGFGASDFANTHPRPREAGSDCPSGDCRGLNIPNGSFGAISNS